MCVRVCARVCACVYACMCARARVCTAPVAWDAESTMPQVAGRQALPVFSLWRRAFEILLGFVLQLVVHFFFASVVLNSNKGSECGDRHQQAHTTVDSWHYGKSGRVHTSSSGSSSSSCVTSSSAAVTPPARPSRPTIGRSALKFRIARSCGKRWQH